MTVATETKVCSACGLPKPLSEFYRHSSGGLRGRCKPCHTADTNERRKADLPRVAERAREWRKKNHRAWQDASLRNRFGIGVEDYERMWADQSGCCAICVCPLEGNQPHVDHNHVTGKVRGILCGLCNRMLGQGKDNPARLRAGAAYLEARD